MIRNSIFLCLMFMFVSLFSSGCNFSSEDQKDKEIQAVLDQIYGEWNWIETTGGVAGVHNTPNLVGYKQKIIFDKDGSYKQLKNNEIKAEGSYSVSKKKLRVLGKDIS